MASNFTLTGGLNFTFQHDARFVLENSTTTIISLFDNASNGFSDPSSNYSSGMIIKIDHTINAASLIQKFIAPGNMISASQGNTQLLGDWETGNVYCGWGMNAYISEYTSNGTMILDGHFATLGAFHYRSYKFNFTTHPTDAPAAYIYALNTSAPTVYYMSWNGATEVAQWRIYASVNATSALSELATVPKVGFETIYTSQTYQAWSVIEALDSSGKGLANSSGPVGTFVPGEQLAQVCDETQCPMASSFASQPSIASAPLPVGSPTITGVLTDATPIVETPTSATSSIQSTTQSATPSAAQSATTSAGANPNHSLPSWTLSMPYFLSVVFSLLHS